MKTTRLEKKLLRYTKDLPEESILEVINFTKQLCNKEELSISDYFNNELSESQMNHVEEEFEDYKLRFPFE